ncbi:class I SAM-dependent DNA methyltransferase [Marinobacter nauticus]|uniref:class I SAM-dependent DNA methyltransferase n=1 Tax=Marinobacter nauticus TaxID=2743 RepID=UPI001C99AF27|nr:class I SAM-dependent methyltransferase [Marinobacter nauticus]MBY5938340.1 class I SAM-dependent methyltransferase [Marinobacter nauticus]MBY5955569.1 class I SAM-dependent methyltransferase [Marinobacter nauticus]MBY6009360.1 class I SAM-dependent methyltransferase [Marinobacter nauticus]
MSINALYTDLSGYYDLMCADIDYPAQSLGIQRLHQLFGNGGRRHLDLACGTGPHIRHFLNLGYQCEGLDINQPMLDVAEERCPEAVFSVRDMCEFRFDNPFDLITCFLYSIHYSDGIEKLQGCIESAHRALSANGLFCFNAVDKTRINNNLYVCHSARHDGSEFTFRSGWHYVGSGERQSLRLSIDRTTNGISESWQDEHPMVALSFRELATLLEPWFDVTIFEHDYERIVPWDGESGNALFVCVKR